MVGAQEMLAIFILILKIRDWQEEVKNLVTSI